MTHTHTSRRWAMGTVALAASAADPEVEDYESERRSQLRNRWLLITGALILIVVIVILVIVFSGGGGDGGGGEGGY